MRNKEQEKLIIKLLKSPMEGDNLVGYNLLRRKYGKNPYFLLEHKIIVGTNNGKLTISYWKNDWQFNKRTIKL